MRKKRFFKKNLPRKNGLKPSPKVLQKTYGFGKVRRLFEKLKGRVDNVTS